MIELPWRSQLCSQVKVIRMTQQIRQADESEFPDIFMKAGKGKRPNDGPLPFTSAVAIDAAYNFLWRWPSTLDKRRVDLNRKLICSTKKLVN